MCDTGLTSSAATHLASRRSCGGDCAWPGAAYDDQDGQKSALTVTFISLFPTQDSTASWTRAEIESIRFALSGYHLP